ncbi:MAG: ABC transporter permease subunit [Chloroflexi bacterium]|nr:ABC transporter permease subunit [Chloroflexota bacterium]
MSIPIKLMLALVLVTSLLAVRVPRALACSCVSPGSPQQALDQSTAVFVGKVTERKIVDSLDSQDAVQFDFQVSTVWKGPVQKDLSAMTSFGSASCGYEFQVGEKYLVYAGGSENRLHVSLCSRTMPISKATNDLAELGNGILLPIENTDWVIDWVAMLAFIGAGVVIVGIVMGKKRLSGISLINIPFGLNPVLVKEMRGRMRGPRAYVFLTATLALLGVVSYGLYRLAAFSIQTFGGGSAGAMIGQSVFTGLIFLALIVICAIAPASTAGAISGEYERKTFDLLAATPLHPASILFGKLMAALSYVVLILLAAIPLVSLSFVFGGIATLDMLQAFLLLLGFALTFSVIGMFFSVLFRRTGFAVVASYLVLMLFVFGTFFAYAVLAVMRGQQPPNWVLTLNPFSAMASALAPANPSSNMFSASGFLTPVLFLFGGGNISFGPNTVAQRPLWQYTVGIYAWLTIVLYLVSAQLVKPVQRFRLRVRAWEIILIITLAPILVLPVVYGPLTPDKIVASMRWVLSSPRDLVANGRFNESIEKTWTIKTQVEQSNESGGDVKRTTDGDRSLVRFSRKGSGHAETSITQIISQTLPSDGWLQVRAVVRVTTQDLSVCGSMGSECPLTIKLVYDDASGQQEWSQGFYAVAGEDLHFCGSCEIKNAHIQIPQGNWYTFESSNILSLSPNRHTVPHLIRSITISAAGHSFESDIAEVAVLVRDGRPPDLWADSNSLATPTPAFMQKFAPAMPVRPVAPPVRVITAEPPEPTATPAPTETRP